VAYQFYLSIEGTKQGKIKGSSPSSKTGSLDFRDGVQCHGFSYGVSTPYDASSGQASGKRQHSPITITRETGAATPQIFQTVVTNETLRPVTGLSNLGLPQGSGGTGSSSGSKPRHGPLTVTREVDEASPLLFNALWTNETLKTVTISIVGEKSAGKETTYHTITLTNAAIVGIRRLNIHGARRPGEEIEFAYEGLETKIGLLK
jgi:type VI protein secretion system component Hcp